MELWLSSGGLYPFAQFNQYNTTTYAPVVAWESSAGWLGFVVKNETPDPVVSYGLTIPGNSVAFHPETTNTVVLRWTAPAEMDVQVSGIFDSPMSHGYIYLFVNEAIAIDHSALIVTPENPNAHLEISYLAHVQTGDTIDYAFTCGEFAGTNHYVNVQATITDVPEPSALVALCTGLIGIGSFAYRRRRS